MSLSIFSWNVAGLRARLKPFTELKEDNIYNNSLMQALFSENNKCFDIVCLQETKCTEEQVVLPDDIIRNYPYRYWNSTNGTTQRKV